MILNGKAYQISEFTASEIEDILSRWDSYESGSLSDFAKSVNLPEYEIAGILEMRKSLPSISQQIADMIRDDWDIEYSRLSLDEW